MRLSIDTQEGLKDTQRTISAEIINDLVFINCQYQNFSKPDFLETAVWLNKKELHDFIGGLLHLQSKLKELR